MIRSHECFIVESKKSRLTVTPNRVTVKASADLPSDQIVEFYDLGLKIAEQITLDRTVRGCFDMKAERITLSTERGDIYLTFNFDGENITINKED